MQKVVITAVSIKEGDNDKGHWINTRITGEDGAVFGTFHKGAALLKEGDVIELTPIVKGRNINFDDYKVIQLSTSSALAKPNGQPEVRTSMSPIDWAEKDRKERFSIESQVAFKGIVELAKCDQSIMPKNYPDALREGIEWAQAHFTLPQQAKAPVQREPEELWPEDKPSKPPKSSIDLDWLRESLNTLAKKDDAWTEANLLSYIKTTYSVKAETVLDAVAGMDKGQVTHFTKKVQAALDRA